MTHCIATLLFKVSFDSEVGKGTITWGEGVTVKVPEGDIPIDSAYIDHAPKKGQTTTWETA